MKTTNKVKLEVLCIIALEIIFLVVSFRMLSIFNFYLILLYFVMNVAIISWVFYHFKVFNPKNVISCFDRADLEKIFLNGLISIVEYDDNLNIINTTGLVNDYHEHLLDKKIIDIDKRLLDIIHSKLSILTLTYDNHVYEVFALAHHNFLIFKNIDEIESIKNYTIETRVNIGLLNLDNFRYSLEYLNDSESSELSAMLRKIINDWAFDNNILLRRLRSDRYLLVAMKKDVTLLKDSITDLLKLYKQKASEYGINSTLSIVFASGDDDYQLLDRKANELMELAQARGGDQMVVQVINDKIEYFGGNSETLTNKSNVRTKIMANSICDLISDSKKVFVFGHKLMDFDSMGSCLAIAKIAQSFDKKCFIVSESGGVESKLANVMQEYEESLQHHEFISDEIAIHLYQDDDLIIAVDHHNPKQSAATELVKIAKNKLIIDHHRRGSEFIENPILSYLDASSSSVCEMLVEVIKSTDHKVELTKEEALIMYTGIVVDTNHFTTRTNTKTFEACAYLKDLDIDLIKVKESLNEDMNDFNLKTKIIAKAYKYHNTMIATYDRELVSRTILSQVADRLLDINGIDATFVIGYVNNDEVGVSARSNKKINVQVIMEKMNGGGHFTAAAVQRFDCSVLDVEQELKTILDNREE